MTVAAVVLAAAAVVVVLLTRGGHPQTAPTVAGVTPHATGPMQFYPAVAAGRWTSRPLPGAGTVVSFDLALSPGARASVAFGNRAASISFSRTAAGAWSYSAGNVSRALPAAAGWIGGGARHIEAVVDRTVRVRVDGRPLVVPDASPVSSGRLSLRTERGTAQARALIISAGGDRAALLLHRVTELHARLGPGAGVIGADRSDHLRLGGGASAGLWPAALWQAAALAPQGGMFARWAMAVTPGPSGLARAAASDRSVGYGDSALAAWRARCRFRTPAAQPAVCHRLVRSVLAAADTLVSLARTNPGAGTIPTDTTSPTGETLVDSTMNLGILTWAARYTRRHAYARLASHQAHVVGSLLVRPDGSTFEAVQFNRDTGTIAFIGTRHGVSDTSTWARGEGWALLGFAQTAMDLHDRSLLAIAQRIAQYVAQHLPGNGVPPWDYSAPQHARVDVSAGTITAAGMFRLALACRRLPGVCSDPGQWVSLGRSMLAGSLGYASRRPPLGFLGSQVLDARRPGCWCNGGELMVGLTYALEALRLEQTVES